MDRFLKRELPGNQVFDVPAKRVVVAPRNYHYTVDLCLILGVGFHFLELFAFGLNTPKELAGMVGAFAGFAAGQLTFAFFALGIALTLNGFIALAIGGLGSTAGALTGGMLLGLLTSFATYFFGGAFQNSISTGLLIILLLLFGGGGFYMGGPLVGGSLGGLILLVLVVMLLTGRLGNRA